MFEQSPSKHWIVQKSFVCQGKWMSNMIVRRKSGVLPSRNPFTARMFLSAKSYSIPWKIGPRMCARWGRWVEIPMESLCFIGISFTDFRHWWHCGDQWRGHHLGHTHSTALQAARIGSSRCHRHCGTQHYIHIVLGRGLPLERHSVPCSQPNIRWRSAPNKEFILIVVKQLTS